MDLFKVDKLNLKNEWLLDKLQYIPQPILRRIFVVIAADYAENEDLYLFADWFNINSFAFLYFYHTFGETLNKTLIRFAGIKSNIMKTLLLIFALLMFGFVSFSQGKAEQIKRNMNLPDTLVSRSYKSQINNAVIDSIYEYYWNSNINDWTYDRKIINKYDQHLNLLQKVEYSYNYSRLEWILIDRCEYKYNESDQDTLTEYFVWNIENKIWKPNFRSSQKYDLHGNCLFDQTYHWNESFSNEKYGSNFVTYKYNAENKLIEYVGYAWDYGNKNWNLRNKWNYEYNPRGKKVKEVGYGRNITKNEWFVGSEKNYAYNSSDSLIEYSELSNDFMELINKQRSVYSYDTNNRRCKEVKYIGCIPYDLYLQTLDSTQQDTVKIIYSDGNYCSSTKWFLNDKDSIRYDSVGNIVAQFNIKWNQAKRIWENRYKYSFVFDSIGNRTDLTSYSWDTIKIDWIPNHKFTDKFDQHGNQIESRSFQWDKETNKWIDDIHNIQVYNDNHQWIEFETYWYSRIYNDYYNIERFEQNFTTTGNIKERIDYVKTTIDDINWQPVKRSITYWSDELTNNQEIQVGNMAIEIYPNPCMDQIKLHSKYNERIEKVQIYSMTGNLLYSKAINSSEWIINVGTLKPGNYLIHIQSDHNTYVSKFLKN